MRLLQEYHWPGNIRELENVLERLLAYQDNEEITPQDITSAMFVPEKGKNYGFIALADSERNTILHALRAAGGNKAKAAKLLGISRTTLWRKLKD
ncbi:MAG: helix-turn-helix domain-containing protein [Dehalobacterium sp.]